MSTTSKSWSLAAAALNENTHSRTAVTGRTVSNGFLSDSGCVLAVPLLIQFDTAFAVRSAVHAEHAQVTNVHAELLNRAAPVRTVRNAVSTHYGRHQPECIEGRSG
jgi:hypothetical protein